jgi:hypothetical protein
MIPHVLPDPVAVAQDEPSQRAVIEVSAAWFLTPTRPVRSIMCLVSDPQVTWELFIVWKRDLVDRSLRDLLGALSATAKT